VLGAAIRRPADSRGEKYVDECRGIAEDFDFVCVSMGRPVCLLTLATPGGRRVFVVPSHLEALAAGLVWKRSLTRVRCRVQTATPVASSLAEVLGGDHGAATVADAI